MWDRHFKTLWPFYLFYIRHFALFPALSALHLLNHTLPVTCYDITNSSPLLPVVSESCCLFLHRISVSFPQLPTSSSLETHLSLSCGVVLSLQWLQHRSDMFFEVLDFVFQFYRHVSQCYEEKHIFYIIFFFYKRLSSVLWHLWVVYRRYSISHKALNHTSLCFIFIVVLSVTFH